MDAKPQRIRVRGDENAPPLQQNKSLHQRNKSMSALNTTVARNTTRRAFGDVSNTNNKDQRTTRDDFVLVEKPVQVTEKPALSQPAQRPASIAGNKGLLNTVTTKPVNPAGKAHPTKTNKRNNVVFRDNENLETVIEKEASKESAPAVRREPAVEEQAKSKELEKVDKVDSVSAPGKKEKSVGSTVNSKDDVSSIDKLETNEVDDVAVVAASAENSMANPNLSEPEEYWDEDETFAHLPHSDNTTGGFTTVVFPKYSAQTRHEILMAKEIVEATRTEEDIMEDFYDTSMVAEYTSEIFLFMRQKEVSMLPVPNYMDNQAEIQWSMRAVLMDWLVQVHFRFNLLPETLYLCVNYIDRFLSNKIVSLGKLQLVGATALYIAAKYEEVTPPSIHDIVYMVDGGYSADEIFKAERFMLGILHFELGWPGPMSFLRRISKADDYDLETRTVAKYFIELTIMDERFVSTPPSFAAAAAHCLALLMLRKGVWTVSHACYSGYIFRQLYDIIVILLDCCESPQTHHQAIFEKYMDRRFKRASAFVEAEIHRGFTVPLPAADDNKGRYDGTANF